MKMRRTFDIVSYIVAGLAIIAIVAAWTSWSYRFGEEHGLSDGWDATLIFAPEILAAFALLIFGLALAIRADLRELHDPPPNIKKEV